MLGDLVPGPLQVERTIRRVTQLRTSVRVPFPLAIGQWSSTVYKCISPLLAILQHDVAEVETRNRVVTFLKWWRKGAHELQSNKELAGIMTKKNQGPYDDYMPFYTGI